MVKNQMCTSGSPSPDTKNRFSTAVKITMGRMGFKLFRIILPGIFATLYIAARNRMERARPSGLEAANSSTI